MGMDRLIERLQNGEVEGVSTGQLAGALGSSREYVRKLILADAIRGCWRVGDDYRIPGPEAVRILQEAGRLPK